VKVYLSQQQDAFGTNIEPTIEDFIMNWKTRTRLRDWLMLKYAAAYRNSGHRYMRTLMEGERRVHTALLFASPLNINE
jgi:hypothetical protein